MKNSVKTLLLLVLLVVGSLLTSCTDEAFDKSSITNTIQLEEFASYDSEIESNFDEIDDLSLSVMESTNVEGGRMEGDNRFNCATVTRDTVDNTIVITVDFGEGCEGPGGHVRRGTLIIYKTGNHWEPGSSHSVQLLDFFIDDVQLLGTRTVTNISESLEVNPTFSVILSDGQIIWEDGTSATRSIERIRTLYRNENPLGDEIHVTGITSGINRDGTEINGVIEDDLIFSRSCRTRGIPVPVSGINSITMGDESVSIDYGDGECDRTALVTKGEETFEVELKRKRK